MIGRLQGQITKCTELAHQKPDPQNGFALWYILSCITKLEYTSEARIRNNPMNDANGLYHETAIVSIFTYHVNMVYTYDSLDNNPVILRPTLSIMLWLAMKLSRVRLFMTTSRISQCLSKTGYRRAQNPFNEVRKRLRRLKELWWPNLKHDYRNHTTDRHYMVPKLSGRWCQTEMNFSWRTNFYGSKVMPSGFSTWTSYSESLFW